MIEPQLNNIIIRLSENKTNYNIYILNIIKFWNFTKQIFFKRLSNSKRIYFLVNLKNNNQLYIPIYFTESYLVIFLQIELLIINFMFAWRVVCWNEIIIKAIMVELASGTHLIHKRQRNFKFFAWDELDTLNLWVKFVWTKERNNNKIQDSWWLVSEYDWFNIYRPKI